MNLKRLFQAHREFCLTLLLFVAFRFLAILAFRPGGLILDFSDFYFYRVFAGLTRQGYYPYHNLWTAYPPLFPALMIAVWRLSALFPPWEFPNMVFTLLLGNTFLLFETGNLVLLYLIARRLYPQQERLPNVIAWMYAGLFVPVYTLCGWFESYPLFFFLLSLYLLLRQRPYLSAAATGIGFMVKFFPAIIIPLGLQCLPAKQESPESRSAERVSFWKREWRLFNLRIAPLPILIYLGIFIVIVLAVAYPFYRMNPELILRPVQMQNMRPAWETVWALLQGEYGYGVIPQDMRDLSLPVPTGGNQPAWIVTSLLIIAFGLYLYTRPGGWREPRRMLIFAGLTVNLFFFVNKGYSPQFLVWILPFIILLLPNLRGVFYAVLLNIANILESNVFFIILPDEHWFLQTTVLLRSVIVLILVAEYSVQYLRGTGEGATSPWLEKFIPLSLAAVVLLGSIPFAVNTGRAYFQVRLALSPYKATIQYLQKGSGVLVLNDESAYEWLYPYLRDRYRFVLLDDYIPAGDSYPVRTVEQLLAAGSTRDTWFFDKDATKTTAGEKAFQQWLQGRKADIIIDIDSGKLHRYPPQVCPTCSQ